MNNKRFIEITFCLFFKTLLDFSIMEVLKVEEELVINKHWETVLQRQKEKKTLVNCCNIKNTQKKLSKKHKVFYVQSETSNELFYLVHRFIFFHWAKKGIVKLLLWAELNLCQRPKTGHSWTEQHVMLCKNWNRPQQKGGQNWRESWWVSLLLEMMESSISAQYSSSEERLRNQQVLTG